MNSLKHIDEFSERDFVRMMLILLVELKKLHSKNILHRDIKPDNIMFYQKENVFYFNFIDFGSSHKIGGGKKKIPTSSEFFSPHEQNSEMESFASRISFIS